LSPFLLAPEICAASAEAVEKRPRGPVKAWTPKKKKKKKEK